MFSLAWLRAIAFFLLSFASLSYSREESVFTSSVTYCTPPESLLISRFEVAYFPSNQSVSFNISAASVQANLNVTANLFLNVYGMNPVNVTIELCNILDGALCPLPAYNFTGADSLKLPSTLGVASMIPGIAFKIPDLEGFAQLTLRDIHTGALKACVQATLSNGWSAHQTVVEWTTGGIAIAALVLALLLSILFTDALAPFRLLELIYLYQTIASSALLNLNYPSMYTSFALNFSWALGLFSSTSIQNSIDQMRHLTGGKLADASAGPAVGLVNRKISPYNFQSIFSPSLSALDLSSNFVSTAMKFVSGTDSSGLNAASLIKRDTIQGEVQTVTAQSSNVLQAGIPIYVNLIHIATANAFMTIFFCTLIMFAIGFAVAILGYGLLLALRHIRRKKDRHANLKHDYPSFVKSWFLRMGLVASLPLLIFIFYQWTLKDSWLSILISVITLLAIVGLIAYPIFLTLRHARRDSAYGLYTPGEAHINSYGVFYARYRPQRYYFFLVFLAATILRALFIAFARYRAEVQIALLLVVELGLVAAHVTLKPFKNKGGDVFSTFLAIIRLVCTGMMIAFLESLQVKAIPRVVIGIVIAIIFSVSVLIVIFNLIVHSGLLLLWRRARNPRSFDSPRDSAGSILEKGMPESGSRHESPNRSRTDLESWDHAYPGGRPTNPTPEQSFSVDNELLQPFPISPTATTVTTMEPPSIYSRESGTMTLGSLLPRRWSFSLSPPMSPAGSSVAHDNNGRSRQNSLLPGSSVGHHSLSPSPFPPASPSEIGGGSASNHGQRQSHLQDQHIQEQNDQES